MRVMRDEECSVVFFVKVGLEVIHEFVEPVHVDYGV